MSSCFISLLWSQLLFLASWNRSNCDSGCRSAVPLHLFSLTPLLYHSRDIKLVLFYSPDISYFLQYRLRSYVFFGLSVEDGNPQSQLVLNNCIPSKSSTHNTLFEVQYLDKKRSPKIILKRPSKRRRQGTGEQECTNPVLFLSNQCRLQR